MEPLNGINKDVCSAKLQPTTILAYPVDCVCCATYWTHNAAVCALMVALACLWLPIHPCPLSPHPLYVPFVILVTVKKVTQNPAVLAS